MLSLTTLVPRASAHLREDTDFVQRTALLQKIASLDLGVLEEGVRGGLVLRRMPLTESRKALLDSLGVPLL